MSPLLRERDTSRIAWPAAAPAPGRRPGPRSQPTSTIGRDISK